MSALIKLAVALAKASAVRHGREAATRLLGVALVVLCGIAAVGCALAALWIYLRPHVGAAGAPLIVAGVLLVLGLGLLAWLRHIGQRRRAPPDADAATMMLAEVTRLLKKHKGAVLMAALVAGLLAGMDDKRSE